MAQAFWWSGRPFVRKAALCSLLALGAGGAQAIGIDTGDSGIDIRWDTALRYNVGMRIDTREPKIYNNVNYDESDGKFDKGDIVTSRFDLFSELDGTWKSDFGRLGARVSGSGWYDGAYTSEVKYNPAITKPQSAPADSRSETSYINDTYSSHTKFFYQKGGELLDAFVLLNTRLAGMPLDLKAGRLNTYWGESFFFLSQGIAYSQQPIDGLKAAVSPGVEVKEVFLPLNQVAVSLSPDPTFTLSAIYFLEWNNNRLPEGGTYFGAADMLFEGPDRFPLPGLSTQTAMFLGVPASARRVDPVKPKNSGDFGVSLRWSPEWLGGGLGLYFRKFDERQAWAGFNFPTHTNIPGVGDIPTTWRQVYPKDTTLYGISLTRTLAGINFGAEVSLRKDTALNNALPSSTTGSSFGADGQGPRGSTTQGLINALYLFNPNPLFDSAVMIAEVAWSHLNSVSLHPELYTAEGYAGCNPTGLAGGALSDQSDGCSTRNFFGAQVNFEPVWLQTLPGVNISAPLSYFTGLSGTKQDNFDGFEGEARYSAGIAADFRQQYKATLAWNDSWAHTGAAIPYSGRDRGWVSLTVKTNF